MAPRRPQLPPIWQALSDADYARVLASPKTLELNPTHPIVRDLAERAAAQPELAPETRARVELLYQTALLSSGFALDKPASFAAQVHALMGRELDGEAGAPAEAAAEEIA